MSDLSRRIANLSPEKRALFASRHKEGQEGYHSSAIPTRQPAERYPLSFAQQRLWFVDLFLPDSALYNNLGVALRFTGELDVAALERSLNEIVRRHEILRTTFIAIEGEPFQVIAESGSIPLSLLNLETLPAAERETEALRRAALASHEPFDLSRGPLLRASVIRLNPQEHLLFLLLHHIITDHESNAVLMREISALYSAFVADKPSPLPELPIQFADFAVWERERLCGENLERLLAYWTTQLSGTLPTLALPRSHASQNPSRFQAMTYTFTVAPDLLAGLKELSRKTGTTLYMQLLAAFKIVLYGYTRQNDIIVGTPVSNRNRLELENLLGMFVNNLVLRTDLSGNPAFLDLLQRVREVTLSAYDHQDMPFEKLVEVLRPERVSDQTPIIQVAFSYIAHTSLPDTVELPGLRLEPLSLPDDMVDLEMLLSVG
nr:non-ribosomal peptide synthetase [Ktedonobacteraceae bacterium]